MTCSRASNPSQSAIKLPTAPKLARLHATTVGWKATFRAIAAWKPRPSLATSVVRKVTSHVTVPRMVAVVVVATAAAASRVVLLARNATAVVKLGTLLAHVPMALPTPGMAAAVAEATARLVPVVEVRLATRVVA